MLNFRNHDDNDTVIEFIQRSLNLIYNGYIDFGEYVEYFKTHSSENHAHHLRVKDIKEDENTLTNVCITTWIMSDTFNRLIVSPHYNIVKPFSSYVDVEVVLFGFEHKAPTSVLEMKMNTFIQQYLDVHDALIDGLERLQYIENAVKNDVYSLLKLDKKQLAKEGVFELANGYIHCFHQDDLADEFDELEEEGLEEDGGYEASRWNFDHYYNQLEYFKSLEAVINTHNGKSSKYDFLVNLVKDGHSFPTCVSLKLIVFKNGYYQKSIDLDLREGVYGVVSAIYNFYNNKVENSKIINDAICHCVNRKLAKEAYALNGECYPLSWGYQITDGGETVYNLLYEHNGEVYPVMDGEEPTKPYSIKPFERTYLPVAVYLTLYRLEGFLNKLLSVRATESLAVNPRYFIPGLKEKNKQTLLKAIQRMTMTLRHEVEDFDITLAKPLEGNADSDNIAYDISFFAGRNPCKCRVGLWVFPSASLKGGVSYYLFIDEDLGQNDPILTSDVNKLVDYITKYIRFRNATSPYTHYKLDDAGNIDKEVSGYFHPKYPFALLNYQFKNPENWFKVILETTYNSKLIKKLITEPSDNPVITLENGNINGEMKVRVHTRNGVASDLIDWVIQIPLSNIIHEIDFNRSLLSERLDEVMHNLAERVYDVGLESTHLDEFYSKMLKSIIDVTFTFKPEGK